MLAPLLSQRPIEARCDRYGSIRLSSWVNDRAAVIGDAAHAMPSSHARGANISIRNAVELALALTATDDVSEALSRWQSKMRPVIDADQKEAEYLASSRSLHRGFPKIDLDELVPANMKASQTSEV
jgi:2-methyl-3-hydroxypyridine 5-carboxylic acid dioxygenase